jgi:hypothetical protein
MITKIRVKSNHIEFQLGAGYGTMGDETSSSVYVESAPKSNREKNLESALAAYVTFPERPVNAATIATMADSQTAGPGFPAGE